MILTAENEDFIMNLEKQFEGVYYLKIKHTSISSWC